MPVVDQLLGVAQQELPLVLLRLRAVVSGVAAGRRVATPHGLDEPPVADSPAESAVAFSQNFPFQPDSGSQASILMLESRLGFNVAATRQKAGVGGRTPPGERWAPSGILNSPAATGCARVIVVSGSESPARLSQDTTGAFSWLNALALSSSAHRPEASSFMIVLPGAAGPGEAGC